MGECGFRVTAAGVFGAALVALAGLASCAPAKPAAAGASPAPSDSAAPSAGAAPRVVHGDIQKLYEREVPPLPKTNFKAGSVTGEVESASPPTSENDDKSTRLTFSLGTGASVQCFVYPKPIDVGTQLLAIVKAMTNVDVRAAHPTDVVVVGDQVAVFLEVQYLAKTAGGPAAGEVKLMAYDHPITPMLCLHDEVGYNAAFKRVTLGLAASLKIPGRELRIPKFVEIETESVDGHPTGFTRSAILAGDGGNTLYLEISSSLVPRSESDLMVEDTARTKTMDKQGRVVAMTYAKSEGGEVSDDVKLKLVGGREYRYEGTHQGKKVAGSLKTKEPKGFPTEAEIDHRLQKLLAPDGKEAEVRFEEYDPDFDASTPIEVVLKPISKKDRTVKMTVGPSEMTMKVGSDGRVERAEMPVGAVKVTIERVFVRGSP
jgi:hypothetical protein